MVVVMDFEQKEVQDVSRLEWVWFSGVLKGKNKGFMVVFF
jgi:hypothetical protein